MNKTVYHKKTLELFLIATLVALAGCQGLSDEESYYKMTVPPARTHQIQTLKLQQETPADKTPPAQPEKPAPPPAKIDLTLEQCRALAMENNLDIKAQLISPTIAAERVTEEEAKFEWVFTGASTYTKTDTPTATSLTGSQTENVNTTLGVQIPLRTGATINFNLADALYKTDNAFSTLNPAYTADSSISISQPLLRNAGRRANTHSIRVAEYDSNITDARTKLEIVTILAAAERIYWRLYAARRELTLRKKQYDLADAQLQRSQRFVDAGDKPQIEVTRAEAGVAQTLGAIIIAENLVRDRERELKRILNMPNVSAETPTIINIKTEPDPVHYTLNPENLVQMAIDNRMEMLELELQIAKDISNIGYLRNQALPLVTLDYAYNINGLGSARSSAFNMMTHKKFEDQRFGLRMIVPLGNQAAKTRLLQAQLLKRQRLATKQGRRTVIQVEVLNAIDQLEANWQQILASRQSALLEARVYQAEMRQFEIGLGTNTDVLEAQTNLANAQSAEINSLTEYQIAIVDMANATGTLLGAAKIQWKPAPK